MSEWRIISSHPNHIVSSDGLVRHKRVNAPLLKGYIDADGYRRVRIDGKEYRVHRLVCAAFHGPQPVGCEVGHLDGSKTNNSALNLAWVTRSENTLHQIAHGTFGAFGGVNVHSKLSDEDVANIRQDAADGMGGRRLAKKYGINRSTAHRIVTGERRPKADAQPDPSLSGESA